METNKNYISILINSTEKKLSLLERILQITLGQESYLKEGTLNMEEMDRTVQKKAELIDEVNELDNGFELLFDRIKDELQDHKNEYKNEIVKLQELIKKVTDCSVELQALEQRNKARFEISIRAKKNDIKSLKISNKTALNYYKAMTNQTMQESYFLDKKK